MRRGRLALLLGMPGLLVLLLWLASPRDSTILSPAPPLPDPGSGPAAPARPPARPEPAEERHEARLDPPPAPETEALSARHVPAPSLPVRPVLILRPMARIDLDPLTREPIRAVPGRQPKLALAKLLREGHSVVLGAAEIEGERKPEVEAGVPVSLKGRVVERPSGLPVEGAMVVLRSTFYLRRDFYDHHLLEVARAETGPDGEFEILRLNVDPVHFGKGGLVFVSVSSEDHAPLVASPLAGVSPGYRNRLPDLELTREIHTVRGRVVDYWEGKPVVGGRVVATGDILPIRYPKDQRAALFLSAPEAVTDEEGRFVIEGVGPGKQILSVHGGNDCVGYLEIVVPFKGEVTIRSRQIRGRIEGRVVDERGRPVSIVRIDGGDNSTHTFADGRFVLENFRGNVVTLSLSHPDYRPMAVPGVEDGRRELLVRLRHRRPLVKFRIRDHASEKPVKVVAFQLHFEEGRAAPPLPASPYSVASKGVHRMRLPEGVVSATISAEGYSPELVHLTGAREGDTMGVLLRPE